MRFVILGRANGKIVSGVATGHGHTVHFMTERENVSGFARIPAFMAPFDAVC